MKRATNLSEFADVFYPEPLNEETIGEFYEAGTMPLRTNDAYDSPLEDIYNACIKQTPRNAHLLLGHKGCGKSTELNVLKEKFKANNRPVAIVRCKQETDLATVTYWDLLILMGIHLLEIADEHNCALHPLKLYGPLTIFGKMLK